MRALEAGWVLSMVAPDNPSTLQLWSARGTPRGLSLSWGWGSRSDSIGGVLSQRFAAGLARSSMDAWGRCMLRADACLGPTRSYVAVLPGNSRRSRLPYLKISISERTVS